LICAKFGADLINISKVTKQTAKQSGLVVLAFTAV